MDESVASVRDVGPEFFSKFIASAALIKNYEAGRARAFYAGYLRVLWDAPVAAPPRFANGYHGAGRKRERRL